MHAHRQTRTHHTEYRLRSLGLDGFTLGLATICIYIENIRFWFIISVAAHVVRGGWGCGASGASVEK